MKGWMKVLAHHYEDTQTRYPDDELIILFDIDGTILDMRYMILYVLKDFDRYHGTRFFDSLSLNDINVHEDRIEDLVNKLDVPSEIREKVINWHKVYCWSSGVLLSFHRPFAGVMDVIRWFQTQPNTYVGLNTGRPETIRSETLRSLNRLGERYKIKFSSALLFMVPYMWNRSIPEAKAAGIRHFQKAGYRVFAMIDNEPENLSAIAEKDPNQEILLLHANTIFETKRKRLPVGTVSGKVYDITELIRASQGMIQKAAHW